MNTPKFKKGDWIKRKKDGRIARVVMLLKTCYDLRLTDGDCWWLDYDYQDNWELTDAPPKNNLEKAAEEYAYRGIPDEIKQNVKPIADEIIKQFIAGAKWQYQKDRGEFAKLKAKEWSDGYDEGIAKGKEQMTKDAVEGEVGYWNQTGLSIRLDQSLEKLGYDMDTKVKIIIVKQ